MLFLNIITQNDYACSPKSIKRLHSHKLGNENGWSFLKMLPHVQCEIIIHFPVFDKSGWSKNVNVRVR